MHIWILYRFDYDCDSLCAAITKAIKLNCAKVKISRSKSYK